MFGKKRIMVWSSSKTSPDNAARQFARQREKMAEKGYVATSHEIVQAGRSKKTWLLLGIFNFARGKQVTLVATFELLPEAGAAQEGAS